MDLRKFFIKIVNSQIANFFVSAIFFLICNFSFAATDDAKKDSVKNYPTRITSDIIDIKRKSQVMEFIGHVLVKKGPDNMSAERMWLFYEDKKNSEVKNSDDGDKNAQLEKKSSIKRIEAKNNVQIFNAEMVAIGDFGYYDPNQDIFVLENNVTVNNGSSVGHGDKFIYNLQTQKGDFVSDKSENITNRKDKRVTFVISNEDLQGKDQDKKKKPKHQRTEIKLENE